MYIKNITFLVFLITITFYLSSLVNSFPSDFKTEMNSDIELLQKALALSKNQKEPKKKVAKSQPDKLVKAKKKKKPEPKKHETAAKKVTTKSLKEKLVKKQEKAKRKIPNKKTPSNHKVLTVNKGMNIAGNVVSNSVKVQNLFIDGKADVSSQVVSEKVDTKKISTDSISVEKIISTNVI